MLRTWEECQESFFVILDKTVDTILLRGLDPTVTVQQVWERVWRAYLESDAPVQLCTPPEKERIRQNAHVRYLTRMMALQTQKETYGQTQLS